MLKTMPFNALAQKVRTCILRAHPTWEQHLDANHEDVEIAVPAPPGSNAGHLVIFTDRGQHIWVRFALPCMCYLVDDEAELLWIIDQLLAEKAVVAVTMNGDEWAETTLVRPGEHPDPPFGQVAHLVSWLGTHDRTISGPSRP